MKHRMIHPLPRRRWWLLVTTLALGLIGPTDTTQAATLLKDSFGLGTAANPRLDSAGVPVTNIYLGFDLSGIRAEIPNTSAVVWKAPGGHGVQSWAFTVSSWIQSGSNSSRGRSAKAARFSCPAWPGTPG